MDVPVVYLYNNFIKAFCCYVFGTKFVFNPKVDVMIKFHSRVAAQV